jgi:hypothetical protein
MNRLIRASYLGYKESALTPALSPRRGRIIVRWFDMTNNHRGSDVQYANLFGEVSLAKTKL